MVKVEFFSSPGCNKCTQSIQALEKVIMEMNSEYINWRVVNILEEIDYAVELGVISAQAIAINGQLAFTSIPEPEKLRAALHQWLALIPQ